jgi:Zn-dependent peptidase ImmA (M78 family)/transcriptional regulator with XRE-family HTH domain
MESDVGSRIRAFREAAGLRAQELAARIDMDPTVLSKIENGHRAVKSGELARIADGLRVSPLALLEDAPLLANLPMAARRAGQSITAGGAYDRLLSLTELHVVLADAGLPTSPNLAARPDVSGRGWLETAETMAAFARDQLPGATNATGDQRLGALADAIETRFKVDVLIDEFDGDPLSGAALTDPAFPLLFVNGAFPRPRSLFTLAHELGHVLLGHVDDSIALDRELASSTEIERMANAFAAIFLMDEKVIDETLEHFGRRTPTIVNLAHRFGVSFETIVYRLHNLHLIDAEGRDTLMKFNWQQQLAHLAPDPTSSGLTKSQIGQLQTRGTRKPDSRLPGLLVGRAHEGFQKGILSIRPLAGLLGEDPQELLIRLSDGEGFDQERAAIDDTDLQRGAEQETSEEAFAGTPV